MTHSRTTGVRTPDPLLTFNATLFKVRFAAGSGNHTHNAAPSRRSGKKGRGHSTGVLSASQVPVRRPDWTSVMVMFLPPICMAMRPRNEVGASR